jgi:hypothetical protein
MTHSDVDAIQLFQAAEQCSRAVHILNADPAGNIPLGILAGHAIEAALKSYLAFRGRTEKELKALGHDLLADWAEAYGAGLDILPAPPTWLRGLSFKHAEMQYRYPNTQFRYSDPRYAEMQPWIPDPNRCLDTIDDLVEKVRKLLPPLPEPEQWW